MSSSEKEYYDEEEEDAESEDSEDLDVVLPKHARLGVPPSDRGTMQTRRDGKVQDSRHSALQVAFQLDASDMLLKEGHMQRPLWVCEDGRIYVETFSPWYTSAQEFLIAIAEPVSRPALIHEYQLTPYALYAGTSIGLQTDVILRVLERLSKVALPTALISFIRGCTESYGKVKLVLLKNRYFLETYFPDVLQLLLKDSTIQEARVSSETAVLSALRQPNMIDGVSKSDHSKDENNNNLGKNLKEDYFKDDEDGIDPMDASSSPSTSTYSFEIRSASVEAVKRRCIALEYPLLEEYDFRGDTRTPSLAIDLRSTTRIRPYQEIALSKMFSNGANLNSNMGFNTGSGLKGGDSGNVQAGAPSSRARSGLIVLPCGAGKTLVGITAACTLRKATLVLCTSAVAVEQWRQQFLHFTHVSPNHIARFTSDAKEAIHEDTRILITTYTMIAYRGAKRSAQAAARMAFIARHEWGFLLLDEVHVVPATVFRRVLTTVAAHTKLGLTATLVREDDKIADLHFLIGPKLYEANWQDLARQGHIAAVQCLDVRCPIPPPFYQAYLSPTTPRPRKRLLAILNPYKLQMCHALIRLHEARGDKIIVFSDNVYALKAYALRLGKPFIYGPTSQAERLAILHQFQHNPAISTLFLSKVGDTSIDLPEATCLIQISSHYGSRRQEAQRLGRILRAKRRSEHGFQAFFYSLVSTDTHELYYSAKRQQFLVDQGYAFRVIPPSMALSILTASHAGRPDADILFPTEKDHISLLKSILLIATEAELAEDDVDALDDFEKPKKKSVTSNASGGTLASSVTASTSRGLGNLSGANDLAYMETTFSTKKQQPPLPMHPLFKARLKK